MNLQIVKPRARLMRDVEGAAFWRIQFPCEARAFAADFNVAMKIAYRFRLAKLIARNGV